MWTSLTVSLNFGKCSSSFAVSGLYWSPATDLSSSQTTVVCRKDIDLERTASKHMWIAFAELQLHLSLTSCTWNMYNKQFMDEGEQNIAIYQITADILDKRGSVPLYRIAHEQSIVCSKTIKKNNFRFLDCIILAKHCLNTHALPLSSIKRTLNVCDFSLVYWQIPIFSKSLKMSIWMKIWVFQLSHVYVYGPIFHLSQRNLTTNPSPLPPPTYYLK